MQFEVWAKGLATLNVDCVVLGVFENGELGEEAHAIDSEAGGRLKKLLGRGDFSGRAGETLLLTELPGITASRALLTGLGSKKSFGRRSWRRALGSAITAISKTRIASIALALDRPPAKELDDYYFGRAIAEIVGSTLYRVNDLKTNKKPKPHALQKVLAGPLIGRQRELDLIADTLLAACHTPRLLLLAAEAGTGKTRILAEAAVRARQDGVLTLAGGSYEQEGHLPYGPIHDALLDYVLTQSEDLLHSQLEGTFSELARVVPELRLRVGSLQREWAGDADNLRLRLFSAVAQALGRIAYVGHQEVLIAIARRRCRHEAAAFESLAH